MRGCAVAGHRRFLPLREIKRAGAKQLYWFWLVCKDADFEKTITYFSNEYKVAPMEEQKFSGLKKFLVKIPPMRPGMSSGTFEDGLWWIKFSFDIEHPLAWHGVQEIGHVVNYLSLDQRLPTVFYPVSPPPYMNGGPNDFLSWVIESKDISFTPDDLREWLEGRLPNPVDDLNSWLTEDDAK